MLHTINKASLASLSLCARYSQRGDDLVLLEDGVYCAIKASQHSLEELRAKGISIHAINLDIEARGLVGRLAGIVMVIGYDGFVRLATQHLTSKRW